MLSGDNIALSYPVNCEQYLAIPSLFQRLAILFLLVKKLVLRLISFSFSLPLNFYHFELLAEDTLTVRLIERENLFTRSYEAHSLPQFGHFLGRHRSKWNRFRLIIICFSSNFSLCLDVSLCVHRVKIRRGLRNGFAKKLEKSFFFAIFRRKWFRRFCHTNNCLREQSKAASLVACKRIGSGPEGLKFSFRSQWNLPTA